MKKMFESFMIRNKRIENRICIPPMVCFNFTDESGMAVDANVEHYREIAQARPGLIIQEATCISRTGKLDKNQLGIWSDDHIPGLRRIVEAVHAEGCPIVVQLHHAGVVGVDESPLCPSAYRLSNEVTGVEMTARDIVELKNAFIDAGVRAWKAGFDGVELHGCHRYLLCQFLNSEVNKRDDIYGRQPELLVLEILDGIRSATDENFIIGIRLGALEPALEDGLRHAKLLEQGGMDFFDISYGFFSDYPSDFTPSDFPYKDIVYAASFFAKSCSKPVFAVNGIRTPRDAEEILRLTDVDMVDIGRGTLADPLWTEKAREGKEPAKCFDCAICQWSVDYRNCPGRKAAR